MVWVGVYPVCFFSTTTTCAAPTPHPNVAEALFKRHVANRTHRKEKQQNRRKKALQLQACAEV
jgi:hypothetical protein